MTKADSETTFWRFTLASAAEAVHLYFQPARQIAKLFGDDTLEDQKISQLRQSQEALHLRVSALENQVSAPFDSVEDLGARIQRLKSLVKSPVPTELPRELKAQIAGLSHDLQDLAAEVRRIEQALGIETPAHPPRSRGATGD